MLMITSRAALQSFEIQTPLHFPPPLSATPTALFYEGIHLLDAAAI